VQYAELVRQLRQARMASRLSQGELAEALGVSRGAVGNYEQGLREAPFDYLVVWARACGVELEVRLVERRAVEVELAEVAAGLEEDDLRILIQVAAGMPRLPQSTKEMMAELGRLAGEREERADGA